MPLAVSSVTAGFKAVLADLFDIPNSIDYSRQRHAHLIIIIIRTVYRQLLSLECQNDKFKSAITYQRGRRVRQRWILSEFGRKSSPLWTVRRQAGGLAVRMAAMDRYEGKMTNGCCVRDTTAAAAAAVPSAVSGTRMCGSSNCESAAVRGSDLRSASPTVSMQYRTRSVNKLPPCELAVHLTLTVSR